MDVSVDVSMSVDVDVALDIALAVESEYYKYHRMIVVDQYNGVNITYFALLMLFLISHLESNKIYQSTFLRITAN